MCFFVLFLSFFFAFFFFLAFCFKGCSCVCFLVVVLGGFSLEGGMGISVCFVFKLSCMKFSTVFYSVFVFSVSFCNLIYFWFVLFLFSLLGFCFSLIFSFSFLIFSAFEGGCFTLFCFRGHWRSGPRHLSTRSRVCAQEWHSKDIHSHIHSHTPMHTPPPPPQKKKSEKKINLPNIMPSFTAPLPVQCGRGRLSGSLADAPQECSTSEAFSPRTVLTENICRSVQHIVQCFSTTMAFLTTCTITLPAWLQQLPRLNPGHSDTWSLMMSLSRTLQVRP